MPHCIIEHANEVSDIVTPEEMIDAALKAMQSSELFEANDIKVRTKEFAYYQRGEERENFIHVTLKILSGRSLMEKKDLSFLVLKAMDELPVFGVEITVDVQEMDAETYLKIQN